MIGAREAALLTLYEIFENSAYSNLALKERMTKCKGMTASEKALLTNLVYGVVSRHYTLIHIIGKYSSIKLKKLADYVRIILEIGLYQLLYTDKIPESAAVNESVKLAKRYGRKGSDRFVNAVLRSFCRDGCRITYPENTEQYLSVKYSYSTNMVKLFIGTFERVRAEKIMASLNEPAPLTLRANLLKCSTPQLISELQERGIKAESCEGSLVYSDGFDIAESDLYKNGYFSVQDRAAYNAAITLAPQPGETVIDMCAAPGGKSTHIAELMNNEGHIISCDIHEHKIKLITGSARRLGIDIIDARINDGTIEDSELIGAADRVLCDVPCSGLGIIRRKPDIKLDRTDIDELPKLQIKILKNGAKYVKSGGTLVYSTCTLNSRENGDVISAFLADNGNFKKQYEKTYCPDTDNSDGFYICKLVKI
ncbi:MAG: 16S rRNA (cytosine(967)-C(5))-methyltransferase RsmB [Oscillospiraceae bacterium]|nr:16S rRNA (cytosine(967)-C(5))-methyltransferase RsmB [Oscillospiraceae bacterium]